MLATKKIRNIVKIDPDKCNGCGLCVPSCAEGAIKIINGKAVLAADNLCDGLGACLGKCPGDAITIEQRQADEFDHHAGATAVESQENAKPVAGNGGKLPCGCPGTAMRKLSPAKCDHAASPAPTAASSAPMSRLGNFPVQLKLLPASGDIWRDADVLLAADCTAFAMGNFHAGLLAGRTLAIACPKLDDIEFHIGKLTEIFASNTPASVTVARMEVPCCSGLLNAAIQARAAAGKNIRIVDVVVGIDGTINSSREI